MWGGGGDRGLTTKAVQSRCSSAGDLCLPTCHLPPAPWLASPQPCSTCCWSVRHHRLCRRPLPCHLQVCPGRAARAQPQPPGARGRRLPPPSPPGLVASIAVLPAVPSSVAFVSPPPRECRSLPSPVGPLPPWTNHPLVCFCSRATAGRRLPGTGRSWMCCGRASSRTSARPRLARPARRWCRYSPDTRALSRGLPAAGALALVPAQRCADGAAAACSSAATAPA